MWFHQHWWHKYQFESHCFVSWNKNFLRSTLYYHIDFHIKSIWLVVWIYRWICTAYRLHSRRIVFASSISNSHYIKYLLFFYFQPVKKLLFIKMRNTFLSALFPKIYKFWNSKVWYHSILAPLRWHKLWNDVTQATKGSDEDWDNHSFDFE